MANISLTEAWILIRKDLLLILVIIITFIAFIPFFTYIYFAQDLQTKDSIMNRSNTGLILLDRSGKPFFKFYSAQIRVVTPLNQIPKNVQNAVLTGEDKNFYSHPGFSIKAIIAAMAADIKYGQLRYGGSTITQQLVKNALLTPKKNFLRKYQELVLAEEIERRYSKQEILEMYLNSVYFGEGAFGVEQAANVYFAKNVKDLDLAQATFLASLLPAPSVYSPYAGGTALAKTRQHYLLDQMVKSGLISQEDHDKAENEDLTFVSKEGDINNVAPHFALMVRDALIRQYGEETVSRSGFKVTTTLNLNWQEFAEKTVKEDVDKLKSNHATNGAAVVINPKDGEVEVLVGSKSWYDPQFGKVNMAISPRQPGSSFKPIVYLAGFEEGIITPATVLKDLPITYKIPGQPDYKPKDYDNKFRGLVLTRRALDNSLNIPSVQVLSMVGISNALDMAKRLGINSLEDESHYGLSLVLGAAEVSLLDLTDAYSVFADQGVYNPPTIILGIQDKNGKEVYKFEPNSQQVVDSKYTFLISSILSDSRTRMEEFGGSLQNSVNAAVKTGTTEDYRDALTEGYTPNLTVGVWVGNNDNSPMDTVAGSLGAAPIWRSLIEQFEKGHPAKFVKPDGVVGLSVCRSSGLRSKEASTSAYTEYFIEGTQPEKYCNASPSASLVPSPTPI